MDKNKEFNTNNLQDYGHHEGQQQNVAPNRAGMKKNAAETNDQQDARNETQTESDRAQEEDNDDAPRTGNSSI